MPNIYLSIGSNLEKRAENIRKALEALRKAGANIKKISAFYKTEPWGKQNQPWFLNCCVEIETSLSPEEFLQQCQSIEKKTGRKKSEPLGPRIIDIDILFYDDLILTTSNLIIPHQYIQNRRFVLQPLAEIAPKFVHPLLKKDIEELLKECSDSSIIGARYERSEPQSTTPEATCGIYSKNALCKPTN